MIFIYLRLDMPDWLTNREYTILHRGAEHPEPFVMQYELLFRPCHIHLPKTDVTIQSYSFCIEMYVYKNIIPQQTRVHTYLLAY